MLREAVIGRRFDKSGRLVSDFERPIGMDFTRRILLANTFYSVPYVFRDDDVMRKGFFNLAYLIGV